MESQSGLASNLIEGLDQASADWFAQEKANAMEGRTRDGNSVLLPKARKCISG
jgi:hypothetical protein